MTDYFCSFFRDNQWIERLIESGLKVLVIVAIVWGLGKLIHKICMSVLKRAHALADKNGGTRLHERDKRLSTVVSLLDATLRIILYAVGSLMALREFGLDITPFLTGAGIAGLAIGFGAQSLVKDVISGFFLLVEDQIRVGDVVKINGSISGLVERMELRVTAIRDREGALHMIPNGEIKTVSNMTYEFSKAVVSVPVPYAVGLKTLTETLSQVAEDLEHDPAWKGKLRTRPEFLGVTTFRPDHMMMELTVKTEPHERWAVSRELHRRVKLALEQAGISLLEPYR